MSQISGGVVIILAQTQIPSSTVYFPRAEECWASCMVGLAMLGLVAILIVSGKNWKAASMHTTRDRKHGVIEIGDRKSVV